MQNQQCSFWQGEGLQGAGLRVGVTVPQKSVKDPFSSEVPIVLCQPWQLGLYRLYEKLPIDFALVLAHSFHPREVVPMLLNLLLKLCPQQPPLLLPPFPGPLLLSLQLTLDSVDLGLLLLHMSLVQLFHSELFIEVAHLVEATGLNRLHMLLISQPLLLVVLHSRVLQFEDEAHFLGLFVSVYLLDQLVGLWILTVAKLYLVDVLSKHRHTLCLSYQRRCYSSWAAC